MPLTPGTRLGPYEIVGPLGAGGMGEVFRARDTRLGREVAVKVLPSHLSASPEFRARFEREAKTVSSLNHPHICTLFDVGREGDTDYLVMELVEGETLAQRLEKGALPAADVLRFGGQIADALDRAHRAGVVHRDLKPGNVMLTKAGTKLLDFGLARAAGTPGAASNSSVTMATLGASPTIGQPLTAEGTIVGTFQYMAPEQLEGSEADARSDLWALGCVLYEMATGKRAFDGKSAASLISSIMGTQPPPISAIAPLSPPGLERIVQACLAKDPADRLQSAHDIRMQLAWLAEGGSQAGVPAPVAAKRRSRERIAWIAAAVGLTAAAGLAAWALVARGPEPEAIQTLVGIPTETPLSDRSSFVSLAPDGRTVAYVTELGIRMRPLGADTATLLEGTKGAWLPFWSPDAKSLAYFDASGKLVRRPVTGGTPTALADAVNGRGGTWGTDGTIVFAPSSGGPLLSVGAAGGAPVAATTLDSTRRESGHRFPCFLPDGEHFLFVALPEGPTGWNVFVGSTRSRTVKHLMTARSAPVYAEPGYLLFERDGRVMAQRFDPRRLELSGEAHAIAVAPSDSDLDAEPAASASRNGRLAILASEPGDTRLELIDLAGTTKARYDLPPGPWQVSKLSPDGRRATVLNGPELWVVDLERSVPMRFATSTSNTPTSVWSPDGNRIAFITKHEGRDQVHIAGLDGRAEVVPTTDDEFKFLIEWSADGRYIILNTVGGATLNDIWILPMEGERKALPYLRGPASERGGMISPDGRWLAYFSDETGEAEVYVQSFPEPGRKVRVSRAGGTFSRWVDGGRSLRFVDGDNLVTVPVTPGPELSFGVPHEAPSNLRGATGVSMSADGNLRLVSVPSHQRPHDIRLIQNWTRLLGR